MFFDTHIHITDIKEKSLINLIKKGITKFICVSILEEDWEKVAKLYEEYPDNIIPAFGLHPWYVQDAKQGWEKRLEEYLLKYPNAIIGETGLDRYRTPEYEPQNSVFKKHIELSKKLHRPVIIHAVKCQDWLEEYWKNMPEKFVFHSYSGRRELMKKVISHGGYISFSSSMLKNREKDKIIPAAPDDKLLIETDAPYQAMPEAIIDTASELALIRGQSLEDFAKSTFRNAEEFVKVG